MLLEVIKAGIPSGVDLGLPEPLPEDTVRLCDSPRLLGDIDLADLTAVKGILPNHRLSFPPILAAGKAIVLSREDEIIADYSSF